MFKNIKVLVETQTGGVNFRKDIGALRAVAFVAVLLYHFRMPGFTGGFAGVDIFLVISGYLMMAIVARKEEFSLLAIVDFYTRRISRLLPPIVLVVLSVCTIAYFLLPPTTLAALGRNSIGALTFFSNIMFWRESGYFEGDSSRNLLLHTWSLSLEVQFYLLFPVIIIIARQITRNEWGRLALIAIVALISFALSSFVSQFKPIPAFYLLPTRLWEFLLGALVFEYVKLGGVVRFPRVVHFLGWGMLIVGIVLIDSSMIWPGWLAAVPAVGSAFIILSGFSQCKVYQGFWPQYLGAISYSGYLWHWPIVVWLVMTDSLGNPKMILLGIASTLILATLTWMNVEQKFGQWLQGLGSIQRMSLVPVIAGCAAIVPFSIALTEGFPERYPDSVVQLLASAQERPSKKACDAYVRSQCAITSSISDEVEISVDQVGALIVGDSHAAMIAQTVADALPAETSKIITYTTAACPTISGVQLRFDVEHRCKSTTEKFLEAHIRNPEIPVVVANRYAFYTAGSNERDRGSRPNFSIAGREFQWSEMHEDALVEGYFQTLCPVAKRGRLILFRPFPEFSTSVPERVALNISMPEIAKKLVVERSAYLDRNGKVIEMLDRLQEECGAEIIDPFPTLCSGEVCGGVRNNAILYTDSNHLSYSAAELLAGPIAAIVSRQNRAAKASEP